MSYFSREVKLKLFFLLFLFFLFVIATGSLFCSYEPCSKKIDRVVLKSDRELEKKGLNSEEQSVRLEYLIKPGDSLIKLLSVYLKASEVYRVIESIKTRFDFRSLRSGHKFFYILRKGSLTGFEYYKDRSKKICVNFKDGNWVVEEKRIPYDIKRVFVHGVIRTSLFDSVINCGERPELAVLLAEIFAWDIDFVHDIREGDTFKLVVEKKYLGNRFVGYGQILAACMKVQGKLYDAYWYEGSKGKRGYYDSDGVPLEKFFLRAPLKYTYISSRYSYRRFHPILKVYRPHLGVDFAAPIGTPIKSVADGVVIKKGYDREGGNFVKIRHTNGYVTIYNHMSRFAKGLRVGRRVRQGDIIGYVGITGLSTGPHLDFRVIKNGRFVNPLKLPSMPKKALSEKEKKLFFAKIKPFAELFKLKSRIAKLKLNKHHRVNSSF